MFRTPRFALYAVTIALFLAGCGGRTVPVPQSGDLGAVADDSGTGYVKLTLRIPSVGPTAVVRPAYISRGTSLIGILINGIPVQPGDVNGGCLQTQRLTCTLSFHAPAGEDSFKIFLADDSGKILSKGHVFETIAAGVTKELHLTFHGIVHSVDLSLDEPHPPAGKPFSARLYAHARDADGYVIIGDSYVAPVRIAGGNGDQISLSGSILDNPTQYITVRYSGRAMQPVSFRVTSPISTRNSGALFAPDASTRFSLGQFVSKDVALGPDGNMWFTECTTRYRIPNCNIGKIDAAGTLWHSARVPAADRIVKGPDGAMWFTEGNNAFVGRIDVAGNITQIRIARDSGFHSGPIAAGSDGNIWMIDSQAIDRVTPRGTVTRHLDPAMGLTHSLILGPDGALWYDYKYEAFGRIARDGTITTIPTRRKYTVDSMAWGRDRRLYCAGQGHIMTLTLNGAYSTLPQSYIAFQGEFMTLGPDGNVWGSATVSNPRLPPRVIGRVTPNNERVYFYAPLTNAYEWHSWKSAAWDGRHNLWLTGDRYYITRFHSFP